MKPQEVHKLMEFPNLLLALCVYHNSKWRIVFHDERFSLFTNHQIYSFIFFADAKFTHPGSCIHTAVLQRDTRTQ